MTPGIRRAARLSILLGLLSLFGVAVSHLALTDIWHGEGELVAEWTALRVAFAVIVAFQVTALLTLGQVLRHARGAADERQ